MSFVKKLKDILFEEEEYTEPIKIREEKKEVEKVEQKPIIVETPKEEIREIRETRTPKVEAKEPAERDLFKVDNTFKFPDFDEEEFASSVQTRINHNVLDVERKKAAEKRNEYSRLEKVEIKEPEKKKFKPSPIISPVYGILNQDYKAEDIVKKEDVASNIDIDEVRKKAYPKEDVKEEVKMEDKKEEKIDTIDEPVVTFFDEKNSDVETLDDKKSIDDLLEEASDEIAIEDTLEIPKTNNIEAIEEELEKIDDEEKTKEKKNDKDLDDTLDSDLFELIDSMYDEREEG